MKTKNIITFLAPFFFICNIQAQSSVEFAAIGDFGLEGSNLNAVTNLIKGWNPEFIITLGDNNYQDGAASTIDQNIGKYFHDFISPYSGSYGNGASENNFFPSLGNHDWYATNAQPYIDYFTLPNNERYYDFVKGPVHFFVIDSDENEPDGITNSSVQANWIKARVQGSSSTWKVAYFHHASYSSGSHGSNSRLQWDFEDWGIDAVITGHDHHYERIHKDDNNDGKVVPYFVNGLGGKSRYSVGGSIFGSQVRYNSTYGAMKITASLSEMTFKFIDVNGTEIDTHTLFKQSSGNHAPTLNTISNISLQENATEQTINLSGISDGDNGTQQLTLAASSSNTALIPHPTLTYTQGQSTGTLVFTPLTNQTGTAQITLTISDDGSENNTLQKSFTVSVEASSGSNHFEPNDTFSTAKPLTMGSTVHSFIQSNGDEDFFFIDFDKAGALNLELKNFPGDYDMYLYNSAEVEIAEAYTTKDPESIAFNIPSAGRYFVKIDGYKAAYSASDDYELTATFTGDSQWDDWVLSNQVIESAHNYSNNLNETKTYSFAGAQKVAVHFVQFETEKNYDFISIKDKNGITQATYHGELYEFWAIVDGDEIQINLESDYSVTAYGYKIDQVGYFMGTTSVLRSFLPNTQPVELAVTGRKELKPLPVDMFAQKHVDTSVPERFDVSQAYPNPFNPSTTISIDIAKASLLSVEIVNILGQTVSELYNGQISAGKNYKFTWNATANAQKDVASGMYFFRVLHEGKQTMRKVVLLK